MIQSIAELRDWQALTGELSNVQKLVHLAVRMDSYDRDALALELTRSMRRAFEDELSIQAARVGCASRSGRLNNSPILSALNEVAKTKADSIVATFNYDLAAAVVQVRADAPKANRHVYASRLRAWDTKRNQWKSTQIAMDSDGTARSIAQSEFFAHNGRGGSAILQPRKAVCPICQGWINRKEVPLAVAQNNPPPYHPNCPHYWSTNPEKWAKESCPLLWMGE